MALPPRRAFAGVPSSSMRWRSISACAPASRPASAGAMISFTFATARRTSRPPNAAPPSRRSTASPLPVEAPAGAIARPMTPPASATSTSTVGRPRESHTRRPCTFAIAAWAMLSLSVAPEPLRPGAPHRGERSRRLRDQGQRGRPDAVAVGIVGDVFDRRLAVDAGEEKARQEPRRPGLELGPRLPGDRRQIGGRERVEGAKIGRRRRPDSTGISTAGG